MDYVLKLPIAIVSLIVGYFIFVGFIICGIKFDEFWQRRK